MNKELIEKLAQFLMDHQPTIYQDMSYIAEDSQRIISFIEQEGYIIETKEYSEEREARIKSLEEELKFCSP